MKTQTFSLEASRNVKLALTKIKNYISSRNIKELEEAQVALLSAEKQDPEYLDAIFYSGLTLDLIGRPADAVGYFEKILTQVNNDKIKNEAQYNLGIAYYHRYGHGFLERAEKEFKELLNKSLSRTKKNLILANMAQTYAMWMIPNRKQKQDILSNNNEKPRAIAHIEEKYNKFLECEKKVRSYLKWTISETAIKNKIRATINNAAGMALMYYSDYIFDSLEERRETLQKSLDYLQESEANIPNDWANTCDLASAYWRLAKNAAIPENSEEKYEIAIRLLSKVIHQLRPDYGFAYYELGRIYRVKGEFAKAIEQFDNSLKIEEKYRDVGSETVKAEKQRASGTNPDDQYP